MTFGVASPVLLRLAVPRLLVALRCTASCRVASHVALSRRLAWFITTPRSVWCLCLFCQWRLEALFFISLRRVAFRLAVSTPVFLPFCVECPCVFGVETHLSFCFLSLYVAWHLILSRGAMFYCVASSGVVSIHIHP